MVNLYLIVQKYSAVQGTKTFPHKIYMKMSCHYLKMLVGKVFQGPCAVSLWKKATYCVCVSVNMLLYQSKF
jgi:hypothetical protein